MQRRTNSKSRKGTDQPAQKCVLCSLIQRALFFSKFPPSSLFLSFSRRNLFPFKTVSYPPRLRINCRLFALPRVKQNASRGHQRSARKERRGARPSVRRRLSLFAPHLFGARAFAWWWWWWWWWVHEAQRAARLFFETRATTTTTTRVTVVVVSRAKIFAF